MDNFFSTSPSAQRVRLAPGLLLGVALALGGCAVLTIDVDVYKGPLTNTETVQVQQLAALGLDAQHTIHALRDELGEQIKAAKAADTDGSHSNPNIIGPSWQHEWEKLQTNLDEVEDAFYDSEARILRRQLRDTEIRIMQKEQETDQKSEDPEEKIKRDSSVKYSIGLLESYVNVPNPPNNANLFKKLATELAAGDQNLPQTTKAFHELRKYSQTGLLGFIDAAIEEEKTNINNRSPQTKARRFLQQSLALFASRLNNIVQNEVVVLKQGSDARTKDPIRKIKYALMGVSASANAILALTDELEHQSEKTIADKKAADFDLIQLERSFLHAGIDWLYFWHAYAAEMARSDDSAKRPDWIALSASIEAILAAAPRPVDARLATAQDAYTSLEAKIKELTPENSTERKNQLERLKELRPTLTGSTNDFAERVMPQCSPWSVATALLSLLTYEKASVLRQGLPAADIDKAIASVELYRARLAAVRPAGAILRTASPIPELQDNQDDTSPARRNPLLHTLDALKPGFVDWIEHPKVHKDNEAMARINASLDKVSWQPINRIKVQGSGETNYVLVKDDLGNWYVKQYAAKPDVIFDSLGSVGSTLLKAKGFDLTPGAAKGTTTDTTGATLTSPTVNALMIEVQNDATDQANEITDLKKQFALLINGTVKETDTAGALKKDDDKKPIPVKSGSTTLTYDPAASARLKDRLDTFETAAPKLGLDDRAKALVESAASFAGDVALVEDQTAGRSARAEVNTAVNSYITTRKTKATALKAKIQAALFETIK